MCCKAQKRIQNHTVAVGTPSGMMVFIFTLDPMSNTYRSESESDSDSESDADSASCSNCFRMFSHPPP